MSRAALGRYEHPTVHLAERTATVTAAQLRPTGVRLLGYTHTDESIPGKRNGWTCAMRSAPPLKHAQGQPPQRHGELPDRPQRTHSLRK
ncbi:hypothetical protein ACIPN8_34380, partial [Streptomyces sp. NPDC086082]|uniref:hypothetical protein n=1 Tax=Streptomyces sp. NPDC086082 TaxID=3365750 RepID=UPI0038210585